MQRSEFLRKEIVKFSHLLYGKYGQNKDDNYEAQMAKNILKRSVIDSKSNPVSEASVSIEPVYNVIDEYNYDDQHVGNVYYNGELKINDDTYGPSMCEMDSIYASIIPSGDYVNQNDIKIQDIEDCSANDFDLKYVGICDNANDPFIKREQIRDEDCVVVHQEHDTNYHCEHSHKQIDYDDVCIIEECNPNEHYNNTESIKLPQLQSFLPKPILKKSSKQNHTDAVFKVCRKSKKNPVKSKQPRKPAVKRARKNKNQVEKSE
ncbi:hypothetical protein GJ496_005171 [Pomphorhynchus laevis]|nr:hypothetical protein GJ496_005171 [Pomphorhynchus laevis]